MSNELAVIPRELLNYVETKWPGSLSVLSSLSRSRYAHSYSLTIHSLILFSMKLAVVVTSIYWSLLLLFPHLILQGKPGATPPSSTSTTQAEIFRIPLSLDLSLHAVPAISLLIDFFAFERAYGPFEAGPGATIAASLFGLWYSIWVEYCAGYNETCECSSGQAWSELMFI